MTGQELLCSGLAGVLSFVLGAMFRGMPISNKSMAITALCSGASAMAIIVLGKENSQRGSIYTLVGGVAGIFLSCFIGRSKRIESYWKRILVLLAGFWTLGPLLSLATTVRWQMVNPNGIVDVWLVKEALVLGAAISAMGSLLVGVLIAGTMDKRNLNPKLVGIADNLPECIQRN